MGPVGLIMVTEKDYQQSVTENAHKFLFFKELHIIGFNFLFWLEKAVFPMGKYPLFP